MSALNGKGDFENLPQWEVVNCNGIISRTKFATFEEAKQFAIRSFPDQRTGAGWDVQAVRS